MKKCREEHHSGFNPPKRDDNRGPSSFYELDSTLVFEKMNLEEMDKIWDEIKMDNHSNAEVSSESK